MSLAAKHTYWNSIEQWNTDLGPCDLYLLWPAACVTWICGQLRANGHALPRSRSVLYLQSYSLEFTIFRNAPEVYTVENL